MKRIIVKSNQGAALKDDIFCMSNVRGKYVKNPGKLPFSFYFSSSAGVDHSIRVKPIFNPDRLIGSEVGTLKLCDDWKFTPGKENHRISQSEINRMKSFFREYFVLFAAVWDEQLEDGILEDYFRGLIDFHDVVENLSFYDEYSDILDGIDIVQSLERFCRNNELVNFYGN